MLTFSVDLGVPEKQARAAEAAAGGSGAVQPCGPAVPGGCGGGADGARRRHSPALAALSGSGIS